MKINVIPINQNGNVFYIGKIKAKDLINIASTKIRKSKNSNDYNNYLDEIDELIQSKIDDGDVWYLKDFTKDDGIQRKQSLERLKEIGKYISKDNTIFPNSIICNFFPTTNESIKIEDDYIEFDPQNIDITIIDGQHRLGGFNYTTDKEWYLENYELVITILVGLLPSQQAELFSTINGKQKPVNKSILYDLSGMSEDEYSEQILGHLITTWFNVNEKSPLRDMIKMLGTGEGSISQSSMITAICDLFSNKKIKSSETLEIPIFRENYLDKDSRLIIQELLDYFLVVSKVFVDFWNKENKSILVKSTGISGLIKAYPTFYIYLKGCKDRKEKYFELKKLINNAFIKGFTPTSELYGGGGASQQSHFAKDLINYSLDIFDGGSAIRSSYQCR